ncbi:hypothetical protein SALBM311S_11496 [Streptomyces alboniger]
MQGCVERSRPIPWLPPRELTELLSDSSERVAAAASGKTDLSPQHMHQLLVLAGLRQGRAERRWTAVERSGVRLDMDQAVVPVDDAPLRLGCEGRQDTVLAVEISRDGFEPALRHACLSSYVRGVHADRAAWQRQLKRAPARVQWDPERDLRLRPLPHRSLQIGFSGEAVRRYADEWTVAIRDVTPLAHEIHALVSDGDLDSAARLLPPERPYPVGDEVLAHLLR